MEDIGYSSREPFYEQPEFDDDIPCWFDDPLVEDDI